MLNSINVLATPTAVQLHHAVREAAIAAPEDMPITWHRTALEQCGISLEEVSPNDFHAMQNAAGGISTRCLVEIGGSENV